jgi:hypothetical protein
MLTEAGRRDATSGEILTTIDRGQDADEVPPA